MFQPRTQTGMLWLLPEKPRKRRKFRGLAATQQERAKGLESSPSNLGVGERLVLSFGSTALATSAVDGCTRCCTSGGIPIAVPPQSAAHGIPENPELKSVIQAWDHLPPAVRAGVLAMVRALGA